MGTPERPRADEGRPRPRSGPSAATRAASGIRRASNAWRALGPEQRLIGIAASLLFFTMFLPWYRTSVPVPVKGSTVKVAAARDSQSAIATFTFVEAAVLVVALGILMLLFARGERKGFHLPGGDGTIVTVGGAWTCVLMIWRFFDKPAAGPGVTVTLAWGIFAALAVAGFLTYAGLRLRAAHRPEPPLPAADHPPARGTERPAAVHIPEDRPHLAPTTVLPGNTSSTSETSVLPREPRDPGADPPPDARRP